MMRPEEIIIKIFEEGRAAPLVHEIDGGEYIACSPSKNSPTTLVVGGMFFDMPSSNGD